MSDDEEAKAALQRSFDMHLLAVPVQGGFIERAPDGNVVYHGSITQVEAESLFGPWCPSYAEFTSFAFQYSSPALYPVGIALRADRSCETCQGRGSVDGPDRFYDADGNSNPTVSACGCVGWRAA